MKKRSCLNCEHVYLYGETEPCLSCCDLPTLPNFKSAHPSVKTKKQGVKYDDNKPRFSLLDLGTIKDVIEVLEHGSKKYTENNWQNVAIEDESNMRYFDACLRHLMAWKEGELIDKESGLRHLAHAICCIMFQNWKDKK